MQHEVLEGWENAVLQWHQAAVVEALVNLASLRITTTLLGVILMARCSLDRAQGLGGGTSPMSSMCYSPSIGYSIM